MKHLHLIGGTASCSLDPAIAGAKAANLSRMAALGLPVPPAFVLPATLCAGVNAGAGPALRAMRQGLAEGLAFLERATGHRYADRRRPLLVSVRSGATRSMPGMLDTVLDVGCTRTAMAGLVRLSGNPRFALDCRRRLIEGLATGAAPGGGDALAALGPVLAEAADDAADSETLRQAVHALESGLAAQWGMLLDDAQAQLEAAVRAVFASWDGDRARSYRRLEGIDDQGGTAVTVQAMVYGNSGGDSGAGVAFSRDPSTGEPGAVVELLFDAQGEDVVSGRRTPLGAEALQSRLPAAAAALKLALEQLEREFRDVQDVEFTIEHGRLWLLQTRAAKRSALAALRTAIDFEREGLISPATALERTAALPREALVESRFAAAPAPIVHGVAAAPGVACGRIALDTAAAARFAGAGEAVILVRTDTSTADIEGFALASGILTRRGGRTAHAALVARQMGRPCVAGCTALRVDAAARRIDLDGTMLSEGDWIAIDGSSGTVFPNRLETEHSTPDAALAVIARWRAAMAEPPLPA